ncbi:hypothetical protein [Xenorhabdus cabanillasii]|uniref:hypothetical protein n=1 Tax=Xenorhabdus cabanillasii TaxID=351673 RepID=UPI000E26EF37|nr:hypothetical protein [Xenorhabdus cabanillasii]
MRVSIAPWDRMPRFGKYVTQNPALFACFELSVEDFSGGGFQIRYQVFFERFFSSAAVHLGGE